jgi:hypothetical protein
MSMNRIAARLIDAIALLYRAHSVADPGASMPRRR